MYAKIKSVLDKHYNVNMFSEISRHQIAEEIERALNSSSKPKSKKVVESSKPIINKKPVKSLPKRPVLSKKSNKKRGLPAGDKILPTSSEIKNPKINKHRNEKSKKVKQ